MLIFRSQYQHHLCQEASSSLVLAYGSLLREMDSNVLFSSLTYKFLSNRTHNLYICTELSTQCLLIFSGVLIFLKVAYICYNQQLTGAGNWTQCSLVFLVHEFSWGQSSCQFRVWSFESLTWLEDLLPASSHGCFRMSQLQQKSLTISSRVSDDGEGGKKK